MNASDAEQLLARYGNMVYRLALVQMKNPSDAEDVVQDTFLQLVQKQPHLSGEEHAKAWLLRVALNRCHSLQRGAWFKKRAPMPEDLPAEAPGEELGLVALVQALPPKYRAVVHLFYFEDLPLKKIAQILDIKYEAAGQRLTRARKILREKLEGGSEYEEFQRTISG